jgi:hypothetical protein
MLQQTPKRTERKTTIIPIKTPKIVVSFIVVVGLGRLKAAGD